MAIGEEKITVDDNHANAASGISLGKRIGLR